MNLRWEIAQFFESRWWENYLAKRPVEGYLDWKRSYWHSFLQNRKIEVLPGVKVLDAGCGPAGIFIVLKENEVVANDPLLDEYQRRVPHFAVENYPYVQFKKVALEQFGLKNHFDKVFCLNVINHVADLEMSMRNLCDAVVENGSLYLSIDVHRFLFLKKLFQWIPADILHPHQLSLAEYESLLIKNGIEIQSKSLLKRTWIFDYYLVKGKKRRQHFMLLKQRVS